jgi:hypothetical protein
MAYTTLISPEELFPHLEDPAWLVVDCQFDLDDPEGGLTAFQARCMRTLNVISQRRKPGQTVAILLPQRRN